MKLTEDQQREINASMADTCCDKDFECCKSEFEDLCPVRRHIETGLIECLAESGRHCPMSYTFAGNLLLCKCPVRKYVANQLGR